ncbi:MAG: tetratricopeptide repeat protein [Saprospirales bacterium]|nr:tetratricopeptide repeat protein [Saprospirales bacterium]
MRYWPIILLAGLILSCQPNPAGLQSQKEELEALELQLLSAQDVNINPEAATLFLEKSQAFAEAFPKDSLAPSYLFKSAEVARGIREFGLAIQLAGQVWRQYPDYEKAPDAMFVQAFIYDTDLGDTLNARNYYEKFLSSYPKHPFAPNVNQLLSVLGKDPEALIQQFEKQAKEN